MTSMNANESPGPPLPHILTHSSEDDDEVKLLAQGAEALLYKTHFLDPPSTQNSAGCPIPSIEAILKYRPRKTYRHPTLDRRLTRHRILSEARTLVKCRREGVGVPGVLSLDADGSHPTHSDSDESGARHESNGAGQGGWIMLEFIPGPTVRSHLPQSTWSEQKGSTDEVLKKIGGAVGKLHAAGVVHGDLTTSNMILRTTSEQHEQGQASSSLDASEGEVVLIDFGLATQSSADEDRAVDLYVLQRAFSSTHPLFEDAFDRVVLPAYADTLGKGGKSVLKRLEDVRMRGRKRSMLG